MKKIAIILSLLLLITVLFIFPGQERTVFGNEIPTRSGSKFEMDMDIVEASLASFLGEGAEDFFGNSVSGAGDVNGDGFEDILIGAYWNAEDDTGAGQTYLFFGRSTGWSMDMDLSNADASFIGEDMDNRFGWSVSGAGDVNGDGLDDFLIGATKNDEGGTEAGQTYLFLGRSTGWKMDMDPSTADASFIGEVAEDHAGYSVSGAGDVNGDGNDDILIGAIDNDEHGSHAGKTYLILGRSSGWSMDTDLSSADASFIGEDAYDHCGVSVSGAGDVNRDGYDDILIGAEGDDDGGSWAGQTYLIFGKASGWSMDMDLSLADASFIGEENDDLSGNSVSGAGDVNGDGYDDILIAARGNEEGGGPSTGQTYLILGRSTGWSMNTSLSSANASFIGENAIDHCGVSVSGAGDVNGDGYDDILIGAFLNDEGGGSGGQTYLVFGRSTGWSMDMELDSVNASFVGVRMSESGYSVSGAGDVNGDMMDDILIGAWKGDEGGIDAGQTYLISGYEYTEPLEVYSVDLYSDPGFSIPASNADISNTIYLELKGLDGNSSNIDRAVVNITSRPESFGLMRIACVETGFNTGIYIGLFKFPPETLYLDTLKFYSRKDPTKFDTLFLDHPYRPSSISSLKAYYDDQYSIEVDRMELGENIYIEVIGIDSNSLTKNIALVNISTEYSVPVPYPLILHETNITTGIYRTEFKVPESFIWLENIRLTSCRDPSYNADVIVDIPFRPPSIDSLKVYSDDTFSMEIEKIRWNETFFIEVVGQDANALTQNRALVNITSDDIYIVPIVLPLYETDVHSGIYRGSFKLPNSVKLRENLTISSVRDATKKVKMIACMLVKIGPIDPIRIVNEDDEYYVQYSNLGYADSSTWTCQLGSDWLNFDVDTLILSGTPDNEDVGTVPISFNLSDDIGHFDVQEFVLIVKNVAPTITTEPITEVKEGDQYRCDFNSTDDGQGNIKWSLIGANIWMSIDETTGWLTGIPTNEEVGIHNISVIVKDGNGGVNSSSFQLTVIDLNMKPIILTTDITNGREGERYYRDYEAHDPDNTVDFIWELTTNASFLTMDPETGVLEGTPGPYDVGEWKVNVTVKDQGGLMDSHIFNLTIEDVDSEPLWIDVPEDISIIHGQHYSYIVNVSDPDPGSIIVYSIETKPESDIEIDPETGIIEWIASIHWFEKAPYDLKVTVRVSDGQSYILHMFTISVIPTESPSSDIIGPIAGERTSSQNTMLSWTGSDPEDETISYDIYLHQTEAFVIGLREEALYLKDFPSTSLNLSDLEQGSSYFWMVIPYDGCTYGTCTSGSSSFRVNYRPTFKPIEDQVVSSGTDLKLKISAMDEDPEDQGNLVYSLEDAPDGMTISEETGMIRWTPKDNQEMIHAITVGVSDGIEMNTATFEIEVTEGESSTSTLIISIAIIVIVILLLALGIFLLIKKKKQLDEEALHRGEEERAALEKEREDEYASYEELYGVPAPEKEEEELTTRELKDYIHEKIEELEGSE